MRPVGWVLDFDDVQQAMTFDGGHVGRLLPNDMQATLEAQRRQRQGDRRTEKFNADAREGLFCLRAAANGCQYRYRRRQAVALSGDDCLRQRFIRVMRFRYYRGVRITRLRGCLDDEFHIRIERLCDALQHLN